MKSNLSEFNELRSQIIYDATAANEVRCSSF